MRIYVFVFPANLQPRGRQQGWVKTPASYQLTLSVMQQVVLVIISKKPSSNVKCHTWVIFERHWCLQDVRYTPTFTFYNRGRKVSLFPLFLSIWGSQRAIWVARCNRSTRPPTWFLLTLSKIWWEIKFEIPVTFFLTGKVFGLWCLA